MTEKFILKKDAKPEDWKLAMDAETISRCVSRISYEILEKNRDLESLAIVGIRTGGEYLGRKIKSKIEEIEKITVPYGVIDITLYRDDLNARNQPTLRGTDLPFTISGARIVLIDDVLYTGRTIRAALDALIDMGRPKAIELAVLIDRGHKELPIRADFVGKNVPTAQKEIIDVTLKESDEVDEVIISEIAED